MEDTPKQANKAVIAIIVIVLLAVATTVVVVMGGKKTPSTAASDTASTTTSAPSASSSVTASNASYKDGSYEATATYQSPGGTESVDLKVTLAGGAITDTSMTAQPSSSTAQEYQDMFIASYKPQVVGQKIDTLSLTRVAGSSLTSGGFDSALDTIKSNAKA